MGQREAEVQPEKMGSRARRETKDYRDRGLSPDKQGAPEKMAAWEILGILD